MNVLKFLQGKGFILEDAYWRTNAYGRNVIKGLDKLSK
jgi:hypothetical protein